jgi:hypothetical protein
VARLRYIGQHPQTFKDVAVMPTWNNPSAPPLVARVGELQPGQEFTVPDELAERYTRRADIVVVEDEDAPGDADAVQAALVEDAAPAAAGRARAARGKAAAADA